MKALGYLDIKPDPDGYGYHVTALGDADTEWRKETDRYSGDISRVIDEFGALDAASLELYATVHFVRSLLKAAPKREILDTVSELKPKFSKEAIENAYDELGLLKDCGKG